MNRIVAAIVGLWLLGLLGISLSLFQHAHDFSMQMVAIGFSGAIGAGMLCCFAYVIKPFNW